MLAAQVALQRGDLDDVDVVDLGRVASEVQILARHDGDRLGKFPGAQDLVADDRVNLLDHVVEADGVGQQFIVFFGVGENRQHANLVHQAGERGLIGHEAGVVAAQYMADAGDLGALVPHFAHLAVDHVAGGLEHLLHGQAGGQVAGVVDAQAADRHLQVGDFLVATQ